MAYTYIIEERSRQLMPINKVTRGVVAIFYVNGEPQLEYGYFIKSPNDILMLDTQNGGVQRCIKKFDDDCFIFSKKYGYYIIVSKSLIDIIENTTIKGNGDYPYFISKEYEAMKNFDVFNGTQKILNSQTFELSKYLKYTFGVEFETSEGYVPSDICFRDGLIPLRDGSITGIEYSTVVLNGANGLNLLKQQCDTLKEYTEFNKDCALHIHFGGIKINPTNIFAIYKILFFLQQDIGKLIPQYSFYTARYKGNGKDYCLPLPNFKTFKELYVYMSDGKTNFLGDLYQAHPSDIERERKWQIHSRYHNFNFVNLLFYDKCKTLELRFLRPTFNFAKIYLWIALFNAILIYAENIASKYDLKTIEEKGEELFRHLGLMSIIEDVYDDNFSHYLLVQLIKTKCVVKNQAANGDNIGACISIEDAIIKNIL